MSQPDGFLQHRSMRSLAQRSEVLLIVVDEQHVFHGIDPLKLSAVRYQQRADGI
jgi:hypothetical protein